MSLQHDREKMKMEQNEKIKIRGEAGLEAVRFGRTEKYYLKIRALAKGEQSGLDAEQNEINLPISEPVYRALYEQLSSCDEYRNPTLWVSGDLELTVREAPLMPRAWDA